MSEEQFQADEALREVQLLIRQGRDSFSVPAFSLMASKELGDAISLLIDRRIALREKELLEAFRKILKAGDERS